MTRAIVRNGEPDPERGGPRFACHLRTAQWSSIGRHSAWVASCLMWSLAYVMMRLRKPRPAIQYVVWNVGTSAIVAALTVVFCKGLVWIITLSAAIFSGRGAVEFEGNLVPAEWRGMPPTSFFQHRSEYGNWHCGRLACSGGEPPASTEKRRMA